jgi:hypothetical protein
VQNRCHGREKIPENGIAFAKGAQNVSLYLFLSFKREKIRGGLKLIADFFAVSISPFY